MNSFLIKALVRCCAVFFFAFIVWIIYLANTNAQSVFFDFVNAIPYGDKFGHIGLFGAMTFLAIIATQYKTYQLFGCAVYLGAILIAVFVAAEEASQHFFPSRTLDMADLLANFVGIGIATLFAFAVNKQKIVIR